MAQMVMESTRAPLRPAVLAGAMPMMQLATGGRVPTQPKLMDQSLWDTEYFAAGATEQTISFFTSTTYANGPITGTLKTRPEFNMDTVGALPSPQTFAIKAIQVTALADVSTGDMPNQRDLQRLRAFTEVEFLQGSKPIWRKPTETLSGPGVWSVGNAASGIAIYNLGSLAIQDFDRLGFTIGLQTGYNFSIQIFASTQLNLVNPMRLRVKLVGDLSKSIR